MSDRCSFTRADINTLFDQVKDMLGYRPGPFMYYSLKFVTPAFILVSNSENNENKICICSPAWKGKALTLMAKHNVKLINNAINTIC